MMEHLVHHHDQACAGQLLITPDQLLPVVTIGVLSGEKMRPLTGRPVGHEAIRPTWPLKLDGLPARATLAASRARRATAAFSCQLLSAPRGAEITFCELRFCRVATALTPIDSDG